MGILCSGQTGKVYLVGAGPGDPGLLTLRGKICLEQADVVLYDNLANPVLLRYAPPHAELIYVGRCGRGQYRAQEEVNQLILKKAQAGHCVVRLKGGDPFVFGRGGEEAEVIASAGVSFEVVPGVTSAVAVPAYAGIPVTHRTLASTVAFITGHEDPIKEESVLEWPRFASADGTLVFLMGMKNLPYIVEQLLQEGKRVDTPVALIRWGTYACQKTVIGTLETIVQKATTEKMGPPTIVVVGNVVQLRGRLNWFETRPLFGKRIVVTRARNQAAALSLLLEQFGGEPVECPTIEIVPPLSWDAVDTAIACVQDYQWLVFTSVNGVQGFMTRLRVLGYDSRVLHGLRVCCIGPRTAQELEQFGIQADLIPAVYQAEGVIDAMKAAGVASQHVLIPRAEQAREILPDELTALGAQVNVVTVYQTIPAQAEVEQLKTQPSKGEIHILTFAGSSTVRNFCWLFEDVKELRQLTQGVTIACIGPITAKTVKECGLHVDVIAKENTIPSLVETLVQHVKQ